MNITNPDNHCESGKDFRKKYIEFIKRTEYCFHLLNGEILPRLRKEPLGNIGPKQECDLSSYLPYLIELRRVMCKSYLGNTLDELGNEDCPISKHTEVPKYDYSGITLLEFNDYCELLTCGYKPQKPGDARYFVSINDKEMHYIFDSYLGLQYAIANEIVLSGCTVAILPTRDTEKHGFQSISFEGENKVQSGNVFSMSVTKNKGDSVVDGDPGKDYTKDITTTILWKVD